MKTLYYNPIEIPEKVRVKSKGFNIDIEYETMYANDNLPVYIDDIFDLAKIKFFESVEVYLTNHNDAYYKKSKQATIGYAINGWVSLKEYKNGGGLFDDKFLIKIIKN